MHGGKGEEVGVGLTPLQDGGLRLLGEGLRGDGVLRRRPVRARHDLAHDAQHLLAAHDAAELRGVGEGDGHAAPDEEGGVGVLLGEHGPRGHRDAGGDGLLAAVPAAVGEEGGGGGVGEDGLLRRPVRDEAAGPDVDVRVGVARPSLPRRLAQQPLLLWRAQRPQEGEAAAGGRRRQQSRLHLAHLRLLQVRHTPEGDVEHRARPLPVQPRQHRRLLRPTRRR